MLAKTPRQYAKPRSTYSGLTPAQARKAKAFLGTILLGSVMAKEAGVQMNIGRCINAYRGRKLKNA